MPSNYTRRISLYINGKEVKNEIASIKAEMNKLVSQQARMTIGSKEYVAAGKQIKQLKGIIAEHNDQLRATAGGWAGLKKAADGFNRYFGMITAGIAAVTGFALGIKSMLTSNSQLSDSMADVAKSTGMSMTEVKELNKELRKIDTRTSREELLNLAYVAGKLGYSGQNDVLGFVKAADQIGVALSKDLGGNVEDAVNNIGKIADIYKLKDEFGIEQSLLRIGSGINALGAASSANEAFIVDFTKRLGGIAPQAGISVENVMGLAATLDQLGQQTETSSTAITQLLTKMHAKPGDFAKIAGKDVEEFTNLLKTDANEALILLLKGLQSNKGGLTELAEKFGDLGVDGSRSITVIGALADNIDTLTEAQKLSTEETAKATSITNEFNIKNDNMASNLEKVTRGLKAAFVNSDIMDGLNSIVSRMADWFKIPLSEKMADETVKVNMLASQITDLNIPLADRNELYDELKSIAPGVLEGINKEAISVGTLTKNLNAYNEQMVNRIVLQQKQEEIESMAKDTANTRTERLKAEAALRKGVMEMQRRVTALDQSAGERMTSIMNDQTKTFAERTRASVLFVQSFNAGRKKMTEYKTVNIDKGFDPLMNIYLDLLAKEGVQLGNTNELTNEKLQLTKELGLNTNALNKTTQSKTKVTGDDANLTDETNEAYTRLTETIDGLAKKMRDTKAAGKTVPAEMLNEYNKLLAQKKAIDKGFENSGENIKPLTDAFQELDKQIKSLDTQINNAIASRNTPLIEKLTLEKDAAELLLETYTQVKKAYEAGWNMDQSDLTDLGKMVAKSAGLVVSDKPGGMRKMEDRKFNEDFSGPSQQIQDDEEAAAELRDQISDQVLESAQVLNDSIFAIVRNRQQAEFDHEMSMLEKKRKAELDNKNLSEREIAAINEKYDKQAAALKLKNFKKEQNAAATMALVNGALAITKTFAAYGFTPAGWVAAAGQALATIAEITVIKSQKPPEFYTGGYTSKSGSNNTPAGIVHANEYVVPADGVNNPHVKSVLDTFEIARQSGNLSRLNMGRIMKASGSFKAGGYTSTGTQSPIFEQNNNTGTGDTLLLKALQVIDKLSAKLDEGIEATVAVRGPNGINEKLAEDKEIRKNAYL